jgi:hypothetical protein
VNGQSPPLISTDFTWGYPAVDFGLVFVALMEALSADKAEDGIPFGAEKDRPTRAQKQAAVARATRRRHRQCERRAAVLVMGVGVGVGCVDQHWLLATGYWILAAAAAAAAAAAERPARM